MIKVIRLFIQNNNINDFYDQLFLKKTTDVTGDGDDQFP